MNRRKFLKFIRDGLTVAGAAAVVGMPEVEEDQESQASALVEHSHQNDALDYYAQGIARVTAAIEDKQWMRLNDALDYYAQGIARVTAAIEDKQWMKLNEIPDTVTYNDNAVWDKLGD